MVPLPSRRSTLIASAAGGALTAFVVGELLLAPVGRELRAPPVPDVKCDSLRSDTIVTRQYDEGTAVARYSRCGARLTGESANPAAPVVVILGDSYVAAREVEDGETMGARLEQLSHTRRALNVRQYGWRGAAPPQYVAVARDVIERWAPTRVVVVLSDDDLGAEALAPPSAPKIADGGRFALTRLIGRRWAMVLARSPRLVRTIFGNPRLDVDEHDERWIPQAPDSVVRSLAAAYGRRLSIVHLADVRVTGTEGTTQREDALRQACVARGVACVFTRRAMLQARASGVIMRGFSNTVLGVGHLNAAGHEIVAREIWNAVGGEPR